MSVLEAITAKLLSEPTVTALIGDRIYPTYAPQGTPPPYVTLQRITNTRDRATSGPTKLTRTIMQADSYDINDGKNTPRSSVLAISTAIREALDGFRGVVAGTELKSIAVEDDRDLYDPDAKIARVQMDLVIWHDE